MGKDITPIILAITGVLQKYSTGSFKDICETIQDLIYEFEGKKIKAKDLLKKVRAPLNELKKKTGEQRINDILIMINGALIIF